MLFPTSISLPLVEMVCFCGPSPLLESSRGTFKNTGSLAPWQAQEMQTVVCKLWREDGKPGSPHSGGRKSRDCGLKQL